MYKERSINTKKSNLSNEQQQLQKKITNICVLTQSPFLCLSYLFVLFFLFFILFSFLFFMFLCVCYYHKNISIYVLCFIFLRMLKITLKCMTKFPFFLALTFFFSWFLFHIFHKKNRRTSNIKTYLHNILYSILISIS